MDKQCANASAKCKLEEAFKQSRSSRCDSQHSLIRDGKHQKIFSYRSCTCRAAENAKMQAHTYPSLLVIDSLHSRSISAVTSICQSA